MANHNAVAHAWAHKTGKARKGFNVFYDGDTIYSYGHHFPIARHVILPDSTPAVLFTTRDYSPSTSQHKATVRQACSHIGTILVSNPNNQPSTADVDELLTQAHTHTQIEKANRARTRGPFHIDTAARILAQANDLIQAFGLARPLTDLATLAPNLDQIRQQAAAARLLQEQKRVQDQLQARLDWQQGHSHRFYGTDEHGNAYCRISPDGTLLQTSQGASVPLDDAKRVFAAVAHYRRNAATWTRTLAGSQRMRVGDFQVDRIDPTGAFKAGCHTFAWDEISRVAQSIGLTI